MYYTILGPQQVYDVLFYHIGYACGTYNTSNKWKSLSGELRCERGRRGKKGIF